LSVVVKTVNDKDLKIVVQDSGTGISEEYLSKIFNPFFTTKPSTKGTGLGLAMARTIIHDHGGEIYYELIDGHTAFVVQTPKKQGESHE